MVVTLTSVLRLIYMLHRFYFDWVGESYLTEFQVNMSSTVEIDVAIICTCLPTIKPFLRRFAPSLLRLSSISRGPYSQSNRRSNRIPTISHPTHNKADRIRPTDSCDEELAGAGYHELDEDGKSSQSYAMTTVKDQPQPT